MTTSIERHHRLHVHPGQARYWRQVLAAMPGPTLLPRDRLGRGDGGAGMARLTARLDSQIGRFTRGNRDLLDAFAATVAAVVLARATGERTVTVMLAAFPMTVSVPPDATFRSLLTRVREDYLLSMSNLDVPLEVLFAEAGVAPSDLCVGADPDAFACPLRLELKADAAILHYRGELFDAATAQRLLDSFARIATAAVTDPGAPVGPWLAAGPEDSELIEEFYQSGHAVPDNLTLHGFLTEAARRWPERTAIVDDGTTFAELNANANRVAQRLAQLGVRRGEVVGVCLPRSPQLIAAVYGVLKAGAAYLPLDPALPANRRDFMVSDSGARLVIDSSFACGGSGAEDLGAAVGGRDLAYVIYTSGSTGRPKGVMVEHRAIVNRLLWMQRAYPLQGGDVVLHKTPFTFDVSVWELFWWPIAGASVATLPPGQERDPDLIADRVAATRATIMHFVPSMLQAFLWYLEADPDDHRLATLRRVFASGEALQPAQVTLFAEVIGCSLVNLYGPTEAAVDVTHFDCAGCAADRPVPIGRPIDNLWLRILTARGAPAPLGTPGELLLGGAGLARGYIGSPALTAARFVPDPQRPGERLYRTGDRARLLPDGTVEFLGRLDNQVKIRGYRIELGEIEQVALSAVGVRDCAVTVVPDGDLLCAYVVAGQGYSEPALRARLGEELPSYMLPHFVMAVPELPTGRHGKRDLSALPQPRRTGGEAAPSAPAQQALAAIWAEHLGVAGIGAHDNFFTLGGDSIKAIAILAAARSAGLRFTFQDIYAHPTLAALAAVTTLDDATEPEVSVPFGELSPADRDRLPVDAVDACPLSTLQAGLCFEVERAGGGGLYHDVASYRVPGALNEKALREAVAWVAERRAVFRTSLHTTGFSEPIQIVHRHAEPPVRVIEAPQQLAEEELRRGFTPGAMGLVRVIAHRLGPDAWQYTLSYAAAVLDGWSVSLINRDLFTAYLAFVAGREPAEMVPEGRYGDFVRLERKALSDPAQRAFWSTVLAGASNTRVPSLGPPPGDGVLMYEVALPQGITGRLRGVSERLGVPLKSVLLAAHVSVLGVVGATNDVLTGYEHSGRPESAGGAELAGLFLNTVPLRVRTAGTASWGELIRAVHRAELDLLPHRRFPMAEAARRAGTSGRLVDTVFNFTHFYALDRLRRAHGLAVTREWIRSETEFPLRAEFWQDPESGELGLALHCHRGVYPDVQVARLGGYYAKALALLAADPDAGHRAVSLMDDTELSELARFAAGGMADAPAGTVLDLIDAQPPHAVAVTCGAQSLTYGELDVRASGLAERMRDAGVCFGEPVAVRLPRGIDWAVSVLALLRLGAVYLPLDPSDPPARHASMLSRAGCRWVLSEGLRLSEHSAEAVPGARERGRRPGPGDVAYILFTSGSTGEPKGARIVHSGLLNHALAKIEDLDLHSGDRIAQTATQAFDISVWQLLVAWLVGARTVIFDDETVGDLHRFVEEMTGEQISIVELVPGYADALLDLPELSLPSALRHVLITGEALPPAMTRRWFSHFHIPLINAYGPTEASDDVAHHFVDGPVEGERVPVGRPIRNTGLYVVGPDDRPVPIGSFGEICVTGAGIGLGYVNDPGRTAAAFRPNGFDTHSTTLYRTGDIGRWLPDGVLDCAGRVDSQVKVRGHRIELSDVEAHLSRARGVHQAAVVTTRTGLAAFYTGPGEPLEVKADLVTRLPRYLIPESFTQMKAFPRTSNGKVDRRALRAPEAERQPVPPADAGETALRATFAEVLGRPAEQVGVTDSFFELGGHSLSAMRLVSKLHGRAAMPDFLSRPTVRALAAWIREPRPAEPLIDVTALAGREAAQSHIAVVCVPYAGGHAASYLEFARLTPKGVRLLAVQDAPQPQELATRLAGPTVVFGHSSGAAQAFAIALALQAAGRPPLRLILVGTSGPDAVGPADDDAILRWLPPEAGTVLPDVRRDLETAGRIFQRMAAEPQRLHCPVTIVVAKDDPSVPDPVYAVNSWSRFADDLTLVTADGGGHYLNATRPQLLADIVGSAVEWRRR